MKKLFVFLLSFSILLVSTSSFANSSDTTKKAKVKKVKTLAKDKVEKTTAAGQTKVKETKTTATKAATTTAATATKAATTTATATKTKATTSVTQAVNKSADKAIGTDAKGRTIYLGPKGGKYVLSPSGKKEYIKKTN